MPSVNTGDIRSEAKDFQRDKNQKAKWALGVIEKPAAKCAHTTWDGTCDTCAKRPRKPAAAAVTKTLKFHNRAQVSRKIAMTRKVFHNEMDEALDENNSDSSAADEVFESSAAPEPVEGVMYSFDSYAGPGRGSQILSHAINQAVTRFENNETEKIVKEYDLVLDGKDELDFADAEDDFELVDAAHLT